MAFSIPPQITIGLDTGIKTCFTPSSATFFATYSVGAVLGRGGFSEVRLVTHRGTGQKMAAKVISKARHLDESRKLQRLRDELRVLCGLPKHPNIIHIRKLLHFKDKFWPMVVSITHNSCLCFARFSFRNVTRVAACDGACTRRGIVRSYCCKGTFYGARGCGGKVKGEGACAERL